MIHKAKKSLGQNFLKSTLAIKKIIEAGEISPNDIILEIGPGKGVLTEKLLEKAGCIIAVEKDHDLYELLKNKFEKEIKLEKLILINDDILKISQDIIFKTAHNRLLAICYAQPVGLRNAFKNNILQNFNYKLIANIPYNITGAIFKKFLGDINQPEMMILMVQHEVAKRIVACDGKESILSISVKVYGDPKIIMKVPARYFSPAPKVDSAIIKISNISRKLFTSPQPSPYKVEGEKVDEKLFWEIIHAGFAHKRKKLSSNLKKLLKNEENSLIKSLGNKRAEELSLTDWINITKSIDINKKE